jgi:hypothetical protein
MKLHYDLKKKMHHLKFMKKTFFPAAVFLILLSSCASHSKKILIFASSDIQVDNTQKNIILTDGTTHHEKELEFSGSDPVTLHIQSPAGKFSLDAKEDGLFIANLKSDTVVGSFQRIGTESGEIKITQEDLKKRIDSLNQLVLGLNQSAAKRNYFIPPGKIAKITEVTGAKVFGPYTSIPGSFDAGSVPEIYKFYTNKEIREIIDRLSKMNQ